MNARQRRRASYILFCNFIPFAVQAAYQLRILWSGQQSVFAEEIPTDSLGQGGHSQEFRLDAEISSDFLRHRLALSYALEDKLQLNKFRKKRGFLFG